ncbi:type II toxin-antitoxin system VapC family toxin [Aeromicrobium sp.]|uniref:type II toxin-antitoxin system VapC family toxin n=1 Tax=Aeromicrobium sp. TaxID=1871063 RepID=UPI003D6A8AB7
MIILDTIVVSEPMRPQPDSAVMEWLNRQASQTIFISAVTVSELLLGVELLVAGRRKTKLSHDVAEIVASDFADRILDFDTRAAEEYAIRMAKVRRDGVAVERADGQIGAIAASHGFAVATRDVEPFSALGVPVIDPWSAAGTQG